MASSGSPLPPVDFDFGAAEALIAQIDRTSSLLGWQRQSRVAQGVTVRQTWKGPYAVKFDADRARGDREARAILDALAALRRRVLYAIDQARADQRRIDLHNQALLPHPTPAPGPSPVPPGAGG